MGVMGAVMVRCLARMDATSECNRMGRISRQRRRMANSPGRIRVRAGSLGSRDRTSQDLPKTGAARVGRAARAGCWVEHGSLPRW